MKRLPFRKYLGFLFKSGTQKKKKNELRMIKETIVVPKDIRYLSDWSKLPDGYSLAKFQYPHILDKKIPGCGFTEYCISCPQDTLICSPRKFLLENKEEQHRGEVFYFENDFEAELSIDDNLTDSITKSNRSSSVISPFTSYKSPEDEIKEEQEMQQARMEWLDRKTKELSAYMEMRFNQGLPYKILVTYDTFRVVKGILQNLGVFNLFYVVVDEFQSILVDSVFKSTAEIEFAEYLSDIKRLCFVSATPMMDKYLEQIDLFKNLPYFELDWVTADPMRAIKPDLKIRSTNSLSSVAKTIISAYLSGNYETLPISDPTTGEKQLIESKEVVFFVNSVDNILRIIKVAGLGYESCNILCAKTEHNAKRLKKRLGKEWEIGRVPLKGEPHKMFTFCTRTVYLGADFYSTNARTIILSDANISSLAVDISLDLPQIMGRQRLNENPWKNRAELYFKALHKSNLQMTQEKFDQYIDNKINNTRSLLESIDRAAEAGSGEGYQILAEKIKVATKLQHYQTDYAAVNEHAGRGMKVVFNNLVLISEKRAFDIQQIDYRDRFAVFNTIASTGVNISSFLHVTDLVATFNNIKRPEDKFRFLCEGNLSSSEISYILDQAPAKYKKCYELLGPERLKAVGYNATSILRELKNLSVDVSKLAPRVYERFLVGTKYSSQEIKQELSSIYAEAGYNGKISAQVIKKYFEVKDCKLQNEATGKWDRGFEILSVKS